MAAASDRADRLANLKRREPILAKAVELATEATARIERQAAAKLQPEAVAAIFAPAVRTAALAFLDAAKAIDDVRGGTLATDQRRVRPGDREPVPASPAARGRPGFGFRRRGEAADLGGRRQPGGSRRANPRARHLAGDVSDSDPAGTSPAGIMRSEDARASDDGRGMAGGDPTGSDA